MTPRDDTRDVPNGQASTSLAKCTEFLESARAGVVSQRWNAAGLAAIHSGIAAADAALIATAGIRSISSDHGAVVGLLKSSVPAFKATQQRQLAGLLKMKNQVAYDQRLLTEVEARQLVEAASRLEKWAAGIVAARLGG